MNPREELEQLRKMKRVRELEAKASGTPQNPRESSPTQPQTPPESKAKGFIRKVANALPLTGGIGVPAAAAYVSGGLSLPATAGLAGMGSAGGTAAKQLILRALGDTEGVPNTPLEAAKDIGVTGATDAALTLGGGYALKGGLKVAKASKSLLTGPSVEEAKILAERAAGKFIPQAAEKAGEVGRRAIQSVDDDLLALRQQFADLKATTLPKVGQAESKAVEHGKEFLTPLKDRITKLRASIKATGEKGGTKLKELDALEQQVKAKFENVENLEGIRFKSSPKFESFVSDKKKVARLAQKLERLSPESAKHLPTGKLQLYRKLGQESSENISDIGRASIQRGRETAAKELEQRIPAFKEVRSEFHTVRNAREDIIAETAKKQTALKTSLRNAIQTFRDKEREAREMINLVRSSERQVLTGQQKTATAVAQKKILESQRALKAAKAEASDLLRQAKGADAQELAQITAEGDAMIAKAVKRSKIIKGLKVAGLTALGIKGASFLP
jgi:hypothetical protein